MKVWKYACHVCESIKSVHFVCVCSYVLWVGCIFACVVLCLLYVCLCIVFSCAFLVYVGKCECVCGGQFCFFFFFFNLYSRSERENVSLSAENTASN